MEPRQLSAGNAHLREAQEEFGRSVHRDGPTSDFAHGDPVTLRSGKLPRSNGSATGRAGSVAGQSFVACGDSRHAGKVCRGVLLESGELVTTPEENLRPQKASVSYSSVSQKDWDRMFEKKGKT